MISEIEHMDNVHGQQFGVVCEDSQSSGSL